MDQRKELFEALIRGSRDGARRVINRCLERGLSGQQITEQLFWPVYEQIRQAHRRDRMSDIRHRFATRLLRKLIEQNQVFLEQGSDRDKRILIFGGSDEGDELAAMMAADLLEADGYEVYFAGGGVDRDEVLEQVGHLRPETLIVFGASAGDLPDLRQAIDALRETDACPRMQMVVGGGVFNRADELAEEIGADLWAETPGRLIEAIACAADRRMSEDQQTVGRKLRLRRISAA